MQILYALTALEVPDALHESPKTAAEVAPIVGELFHNRFAVIHRVTRATSAPALVQP